MFKSLSQFEFIFVYAKSVRSNFTLIYMRLTFPTPLAKETVFFPLSTLASGNWFLRTSTCHLFNYKEWIATGAHPTFPKQKEGKHAMDGRAFEPWKGWGGGCRRPWVIEGLWMQPPSQAQLSCILTSGTWRAETSKQSFLFFFFVFFVFFSRLVVKVCLFYAGFKFGDLD